MFSVDINTLREVIQKNPKLTHRNLAERFGVSIPHIGDLIKRHKIPYQSKKGISRILIKKETLEDLILKDFNQKEMAEILETSPSVISRRINLHGLAYSRKKNQNKPPDKRKNFVANIR
jgi:transposase